MTDSIVSDEQLVAYLREELPLVDLARVEQALRTDKTLAKRASRLAMRRDLSSHDVGAIWRSDRLSCPDRGELGEYLLGTLAPDRADYISFHFRTLGCRYCAANLADLQARSQESAPDTARRRRYFESSAGRLKANRPDDRARATK